jgi:hypothetical protein
MLRRKVNRDEPTLNSPQARPSHYGGGLCAEITGIPFADVYIRPHLTSFLLRCGIATLLDDIPAVAAARGSSETLT